MIFKGKKTLLKWCQEPSWGDYTLKGRTKRAIHTWYLNENYEENRHFTFWEQMKRSFNSFCDTPMGYSEFWTLDVPIMIITITVALLLIWVFRI